MRKLSLYLNDDRYERLSLLVGSDDEEAVEEAVNEMIYDAIATAWLKYKENQMKNLLKMGSFENEEE